MEQTPCLYPAPPACRTVSASGHGISGPRWIVKWGDAPETPPERRGAGPGWGATPSPRWEMGKAHVPWPTRSPGQAVPAAGRQAGVRV